MVNPRPVTVTADPQTKQYGVADPLLAYQVTEGDLVFNDAFTGELTRELGEDAGLYAILQGTLALSANYTLTYIGDYLTITKADPVCEVTPYLLEYDQLAHTATGACLGVDGNPLDGLDLSSTTHTEIGTYLYDPWTFTDVSGNYNDADGTATNLITLRAITVAADAKTKVYGQPDPELTYQITLGSLLSGDAFSGALSRQPGENIGTYAILKGSLVLPDYYNILYIGENLTISGYRYLYPIMLRSNP